METAKALLAPFVPMLFLLWLGSPMIGVYIGRKKGRSDLVGALGGILLGPLVLFMFALTPIVRCAYCKSGLLPGAVTCAKCGKDQPAA